MSVTMDFPSSSNTITNDVITLGSSPSSKNNNEMSISPASSYSPLARYSMTNPTSGRKRAASIYEQRGEKENSGSQRPTSYDSQALVHNARNVLLANTLRCMNTNSQLNSQYHRSQSSLNLAKKRRV
jgi:hypothetical protein